MQSQNRVKVAVIGSGLAGLTTAYILSGKNSNDQYEPHLFEKGEKLGMDAASVSIGVDNDEFRIDVPMRSFMSGTLPLDFFCLFAKYGCFVSLGYYNHLIRLYDHLRIPVLPAKFSFGWYRIQSPSESISAPAEKVASYTTNIAHLTYSGSRTIGFLESAGSSSSAEAGFTGYVANIINAWYKLYIVSISYIWLMALALWLRYRGHLYNSKHPVFHMTLGTWFEQNRFHPYFVHEVFVPLFAAVCTNSWKSMLDYPAADILEYMAMGLFQESYVVSGGVRKVVDSLSDPLDHVHLGTQIVSIRPSDTPGYVLDLHDAQGNIYHFHHVVFATQANQASRILHGCLDHLDSTVAKHKRLADDIRSSLTILDQFQYDKAIVINHTDDRLLPHDRQAWRSLNFASLDTSVRPTLPSDNIVPYPHDTTMTTHILNLTHSAFRDGSTIYMQTTNPCVSPDPAQILSKAWFERATVTLASKKAILDGLFTPTEEADTQSLRLGRCQGLSGIWFVGSYSWPGIPLLEGCVASAEMVATQGIAKAENMPIDVPW
ncbi:hypothetical protein BX666DRAFT_1423201 [Dichotomocladium elegans]|nr:hypothetical protein BX666DRAFT_1423201 [Dichotomocladium elegans]